MACQVSKMPTSRGRRNEELCFKCEHHYSPNNQCPNQHSYLGILTWEGTNENEGLKESLSAADYKDGQGDGNSLQCNECPRGALITYGIFKAMTVEGCLEVYPLIDSGASQLHYRQTSASLVLPVTTTKEFKVGLPNGNLDRLDKEIRELCSR
ncbi:hypothetical protein L195_g002886 [Trifolium pratense]|uniref:Uncharacterized protein n=1 Tax=Trifolium pratense TaxID=57577 RepID=A0A2K3NTS3_TRIPR|nr:hypothetical protein L195_g002886 [Trifolium pratense]